MKLSTKDLEFWSTHCNQILAVVGQNKGPVESFNLVWCLIFFPLPTHLYWLGNYLVSLLVSTAVECDSLVAAAHRVVMVTICILLSLSHGSTSGHHSPSSSIVDGFNLTNMVVDDMQFQISFMYTVFNFNFF